MSGGNVRKASAGTATKALSRVDAGFMCLPFTFLVRFFFQAEDGIRDRTVTGVQTCALPIYVLGERPGQAARPHLVFSAHLDTIFPEGTNVKVKREGTVLRGPGIGDDCRGLAVVLGVIRALEKGRLQTPGTITFVGTVGEEGLGDLRGVKELFRETLKSQIDRFVSVDGTGLGTTYVAVGSRRYRVTFRGSGGHSYGSFGVANPIHALGRAIDAVADFQVQQEPRTTFSVGRIGGGTSVNASPTEAWMEIDLRSADPAALRSFYARFHKAVDQSLAQDIESWYQSW